MEFTMQEISNRAEYVFGKMDNIEKSTPIKWQMAWKEAKLQLTREWKLDKSSFNDMKYQELEDYERATYELLKILSKVTVPKQTIYRLVGIDSGAGRHFQYEFPYQDDIDIRVAIIEISKVNSGLRKKFYKQMKEG